MLLPHVFRSFPLHHPDAMAPAPAPTAPAAATPAPATLTAPVPANLPTLPPAFIAATRAKPPAERDAAAESYANLTGGDPAGVKAALYTAIAALERGESIDGFKRKLTGYTLPESVIGLAREAHGLGLTLTLTMGAPDASGVSGVTLTAQGGTVQAPRPAQGGNGPGVNRVAGVVSGNSRISAFDAAERGRKAGDNIDIAKNPDGTAIDRVSGEAIPARGLTGWLKAREATVARNAVAILRQYGQVD